MDFTEYLIRDYGFNKIINPTNEGIDYNGYTCILRIHVLHYLVYSPLHKSISLRLKHDDPKGKSGGGVDYVTELMIPILLYCKKDVDRLLSGMQIVKQGKRCISRRWL